MALTHRKLDDRVAVAPQISEADIAEAAGLGYRTIINNRPDNEEPGQLSAARAAEVARSYGLNYVHVPVTMATLGAEAVADFDRAVRESTGPVLAHCRSGTRSTHLWAYAEARAGRFSLDEIVHRGAQAGYDLEPLRPALKAYAGQAR